MANFEKLFNTLRNQTNSANTSCKEFTSLLIDLGFQIENCNSGGHKIAKHPAIDLSEYPDYNCGHDQGEKIRRQYIKKLYKFVNQHKDVIEEYLL